MKWLKLAIAIVLAASMVAADNNTNINEISVAG